MIHFTIPTTPQFDFAATVGSHGWAALAPFYWDAERAALSYIYESSAGDVQRLIISESDEDIRVALPDSLPLPAELEAEYRAAVKCILNIDWDLGAFYAAMGEHEGYGWLENERRGRILICPSMWEDLAKVLLTTNCNWAQTVNMSRRLCALGAAHPTLAGSHAFPSPQRIAEMEFDALAEAVRGGYRNAYLYEACGEDRVRPGRSRCLARA